MKRPALLLVVLVVLVGCGGEPTPGAAAPVTERPKAAPERGTLKLPVEPAVVERGVEALGEDRLMIVVTASGILIEGVQVVPVTDGDVPAAEKEDGALGLTVPKLTRALETRGTTAPVAVLVDPAVGARLLFSVMVSAGRAGVRTFRLVVARPDGTIGALPIDLPERKPSGDLAAEIEAVKKGVPPPPKQKQPVGPIISATRDKVILWSIGGVEGTLAAPKLEVAVAGGRSDLAPLTAALVDIAERHWPDPAARPPDSRSIIIQVGRDTSFSQLASLIAAARTQPDGSPLFPDVLLGMGFD